MVDTNAESSIVNSRPVSVSFGVRGDSLVPSALTSLLGIQPSHAFAKGDQYDSKTGIRKRPWGVWQLRSDAFLSSPNAEDHARFILEQVEPKKDVIMTYLANDQFYVDVRIWCEGEIASFGISSIVLGRLAALCKEFNFSLIAAGNGD
jgi:hypothetical protein